MSASNGTSGELPNAHELVAHLVPDGSRVLDIGCGFGAIAGLLKARGCAITGVEPDPERRAVSAEFCEAILDGVAEGLGELPVPTASYDAILFADVLEHLVDPWGTLREVLRFLKPGGRVVISIPNIANFGVRANLLKGQFSYQDYGIYDRTHLRFFTRATAEELVRSAGLKVVAREYTSNLTDTRAFKRTLGRIGFLRRMFQGLDHWLTYHKPELFAIQFILACEREG